MAVGHGGDESKHPALVKIAILEFIETRFKEIVENDQDLKDEFRAKLIKYLADCGVTLTTEQIESIVNNKVADYYVKVYDPFNTEMDFYIFFNVDWPKYLELYSEYYKMDKKARDLVISIAAKYPNYDSDIKKAIQRDVEVDTVFNASRSKSTIFYTIDQMKNILECGKPDECPPP